jgi:UDP-glucose-4-epimerase GalE
MSKTILVTGGAGYIGSHACKALAKAGYEPVSYDSLVRGHREAVRWGPLVEGDLADRELLAATMKRHAVAAVMHFAAFAYVEESVKRPELYFRNNVINSLGLFETMLAAKVKHIVFSSTCATYGVPAEMPIRETTPQHPVNPYGEGKLMVERALSWLGPAHGLTHTCLRYFNAAGADPDGETGEDHDPETHLIPLILDAALKRRSRIDIYGTDYPTPDGTAVRDYIHVQDLAEAHVKALQYLEGGGDSVALNLGTGRGCSVRETIAATERVTGLAIPKQESPRRAGDPPMLVADPSLAGKMLGWQARMSGMDNIIATAWAWHTRHQPHKKAVLGAAGT